MISHLETNLNELLVGISFGNKTYLCKPKICKKYIGGAKSNDIVQNYT